MGGGEEGGGQEEGRLTRAPGWPVPSAWAAPSSQAEGSCSACRPPPPVLPVLPYIRYLLLYISEGCQPANRIFYVNLVPLQRSAATGAIDFPAYDFFMGANRGRGGGSAGLHEEEEKEPHYCAPSSF